MKVTADDIAQLLAATPPRKVPPAVERAAQGGGGGCVASGFGLVFGAFGMIFVFVFFPWQFWNDWQLANTDKVRGTDGFVQSARESNMSINDIKVWVYEFDYTVPDGRRLSSTCYTTGRRWTEGSVADARYLPNQPTVAVLAGARLSEGGWFGLFTLIFPLIGFGLAAGVFLGRRHTRRLLREGHMAEVDIVSVDGTNTRVNDQTVYRITCSNPLGSGSPVTIKRTAPADVDLALKHFREKQPVFVLYDPRKPTRIIFPEALIDPA